MVKIAESMLDLSPEMNKLKKEKNNSVNAESAILIIVQITCTTSST